MFLHYVNNMFDFVCYVVHVVICSLENVFEEAKNGLFLKIVNKVMIYPLLEWETHERLNPQQPIIRPAKPPYSGGRCGGTATLSQSETRLLQLATPTDSSSRQPKILDHRIFLDKSVVAG